MKKGLTLFAVLLSVIGCNPQKKNKESAETKQKKFLVIYYSQTGATQKVAHGLAELLDADTLRIEAEQPYDGTYEETIERCKREMSGNELPALKEIKADLSKYDTILIGYPVWFGTYARPVASLISGTDFAGKKIIPFCTFGSGGLESSAEDLRRALPKAEILPGYGIRNARIAKSKAEIERFLAEYGYIDKQVEKLPEYSEQQPVTPADTEIFNAACGDYQYPLGTPLTVGKRDLPEGTEYRFTAQSKDAEGRDTEAVIYVIAGAGQGEKPEFTKVVR